MAANKRKMSAREFSRRADAAEKALQEAVIQGCEQVVGEWDQDDESTAAHLVGLHDALAYALGSVTHALLHCAEAEAVHTQFAHMMHAGFGTDFVGTFRKKVEKEKRRRRPSNVVRLPVVHREPR